METSRTRSTGTWVGFGLLLIIIVCSIFMFHSLSDPFDIDRRSADLGPRLGIAPGCNQLL